MNQKLLSPGERLTELASERGNDNALIFVRLSGIADVMTWAQLEAAANRLAHRMAEHGVGPGRFVAIGLPNSPDHTVATLAAWKLGACVVPLASTLPDAERERMLGLIHPHLVVADWAVPHCPTIAKLADLAEYPDNPPEPRIPSPFKAIASGGSTGAPKLIVTPTAWAYPVHAHPHQLLADIRERDVTMLPGPLYHNQAFLFSQVGLFAGSTVVLFERFRPELALQAIARYNVTIASLVPTMMSRMLHVLERSSFALDSLRLIWHMSAPCPEWVKRGWIELIGPEKVCELWAATELTGITTIRGDEWLTHVGSVGRGWRTDISIRDADGAELPTGEIGEIFSRLQGSGGPNSFYLGAEALTVDDGFASVGDLGWVDDEGYLYIADRRVDLIITGGANVYPAEVEAALSQHPDIVDVAIVGLPDPDLGRRVHAVVVLAPGAKLDIDRADEFCRERLARYKCPRSYTAVGELPRDEAGKLRRSLLAEQVTAAR